MTFDDDFLQFEFPGGTKRVALKTLGLDWPPPEQIDFMGFPMRRDTYSQITDEQRTELTMVMRGARYVPVEMPT